MAVVGVNREANEGRVIRVDDDLHPPHERVAKGLEASEVDHWQTRCRMAKRLVDTLPVRRALTLDAADVITELALNGTAFLLVPATIGPQGARITAATVGGAAVPIAPLQALIQPAPATIPAEVQVFVGTGGVIQLNFTPALNVTAETDIEIQVEVGVGTFAQLKATLKLRP